MTQARHACLDPGRRSPQAPASAPHCLWPAVLPSPRSQRGLRLRVPRPDAPVSPDRTPSCPLPLCGADVSLLPTQPPWPVSPAVGIWGHRLSWKAGVRALRTGDTCGSAGLRTGAASRGRAHLRCRTWAPVVAGAAGRGWVVSAAPAAASRGWVRGRQQLTAQSHSGLTRPQVHQKRGKLGNSRRGRHVGQGGEGSPSCHAPRGSPSTHLHVSPTP